MRAFRVWFWEIRQRKLPAIVPIVGMVIGVLLGLLALVMRETGLSPAISADSGLPSVESVVWHSAYAVLGISFVGIVPNVLHSWVQSRMRSRLQDVRGFWHHHDLSSLVGETLRMVLSDAAIAVPSHRFPWELSPNTRVWLAEHAQKAPELWKVLVSAEWPRRHTEWAALSDENLADVLDDKPVEVLKPWAWRDLIRMLNGGRAPPFAGTPDEDALIRRLNGRFGEGLCEAVKDAWVMGEHAGPAFNLLCFRRLFAQLSQVEKLQSEIKELLVAYRDRIEQLAAESSRHYAEVLAAFEDLSLQISGIEKRLSIQLRDLSAHLHALTPRPILSLPRQSGAIPKGHLFSEQLVEMVARVEEQRLLRAFLDSPEPFACWLWHGPAGIGKSRLALKLCQERTASRDGLPSEWDAGFLVWNSVDGRSWSGWELFKPTLIVMDMVWAHSVEVRKRIFELQEKAHGQKIRVLLLDRDVDEESVNSLLRPEEGGAALKQRAWRKPYALMPLKADDVLLMVQRLHEARTQEKGGTLPQIPLPVDADERRMLADRLLALTHGGRPLFVSYAADALFSGHSLEQWNSERLLEEVLREEREKWKGRASAMGRIRAELEQHERLIVLAVMANGLSHSAGYRGLRAIAETHGAGDLLPPAGAFDANWGLLEKMYSLSDVPPGETIPPLRPDYIGELLVLDNYRHATINPHAQKAMLRAAFHLNSQGAQEFLRRLLQDFKTPELQVLFDLAIEISREQPSGLPSLWRPGQVEASIAGLCWRLGLLDQTRLWCQRAIECELSDGAVHLFCAILLLDECADPEGAKCLLERLEQMLEVRSYPLVEAARLLADRFNDVEGAKRLLKRVEKMPEAGPGQLVQSARLLAERCNDVGGAKRLLERVEKTPEARPQHLVEAAGQLAGHCKDVDGAKRLLERLERMPEAGPQHLVEAAGLLAGRCNDVEDAKRLLKRVEKMPEAGPQHLATAAGLLAGRCKDADGAKRLLIQFKEMPWSRSGQLAKVVQILVTACNDRDSAISFLTSARQRCSGDVLDLLLCGDLSWSVLNDIEAAAAIYQEARQQRRLSTITRSRTAVFELVRGNKRRGGKLLRLVLAHVQARAPRYTDCYVWLLALAVRFQPEESESLARIKGILSAGIVQRQIMGLSLIVEHAVPSDAPDRCWMEQLVRVIQGEAHVNTLEGWTAWREA